MSRLANLFLVLLAVGVGFLICEAYLRIFPIQGVDQGQTGLYQPHPTRGFAYRPNVRRNRWDDIDWKINAEGFRDYEHSEEKSRTRILALGDSFFAGHEVSFEDSFLARLEQDLKVEIVKMGIGGYGTTQERLLWEEKGVRYQPDIVLLGVYLLNDVSDDAFFPGKYCLHNGNLIDCDPAGRTWPAKLLVVAAEHSVFARLTLQSVRHWLSPPASQPEEREGLFRYANSALALYQRTRKPWVVRGFEIVQRNILDLDRSVTAHRGTLVVILIPAESQIYDWQWAQYIEQFSLNAAEYDRFKVIQRLTAFLSEKGMRYIDLLPRLRQAGETDPDLHPGHWHWSVKANALVADVVGEYLRSHHLLQAPADIE
jgi:hypothetical protein